MTEGRGVAPEAGLLGRLAGWSYDRRRLVLLTWGLVLVIALAVSHAVGTSFENKFTAGNTPSQQAQDILKSRFPSMAGDQAQVVFHTTAPITDPANQAAIARLDAQLDRLAHVVGVEGPVGLSGAHQVASDGHIAYATVQFDTTTYLLKKQTVQAVITTAENARHAGFDVQLGGTPIATVVQAAPGPSEGIGITAAMLIMLLAFGSVVAMGLPIVSALFGLLVGVAVLELLTHVLVVPTFSPEMAVMIGLGVGIDYALFVVTRYRQGLAEGRDPRQAVVVSLATAGRAVLLAGSTVVISLLGLYVIGQPYMVGVATASIVAVLLVMVATLTLLPCLLGYSGRAIDRLSVPGLSHDATPRPTKGFWYRWSRTVQRRAWLTGSLSVVVLVALALPLFSMRLAFTDAGNAPTNLTVRQAYDLLAEGFGPGFNGPLIVAVKMNGQQNEAAVIRLDRALHAMPGTAQISPPIVNRDHTAAVITLIPAWSPESAQTQALVHTMRNRVIPQALHGTGVVAEVGGETAAGIDAASYLSGRMIWVLAAVIVLAVVLLMAVFRSVAVPIKAALMNLLSVGAAYGVLVAVFEWGWLGGLVGIGHTGPIDPWIPITMFTILFGLSMDYEVFLLSRIREEWRRTGDTSESVADGLAVTARVITAAAAIMFCVFGSFVVNDPLHVLKVFGLGMAVAVLVDATLVRMVLVPSVMEILGPLNWWMPRWLDRIVPRVGSEVDVDVPEAAHPPEPVGALGGPSAAPSTLRP